MPKNRTYPDCFDEAHQITITWLSQWGYMKPFARKSGSLSWTQWGRPTGSISFTVDMQEEYIHLDYSIRDNPISYRVRFESLPSNLGKGRVWYFICPRTGKRCRTLYGIGAYFLSRHAFPNAMYRCQTEPKSERGFRRFLTLNGTTKNPKAEWDFQDRKHYRTHYKGRITKRYQDYLERTEKLKEVVESGIWRTNLFQKWP